MSFKGLEVSGLLDTGATKRFISRELICKDNTQVLAKPYIVP